MSLFNLGNKTEYYSVIKMYKIIDFEQAQKINISEILLSSFDFIFSVEQRFPNRYDINLGKHQWRSKKAFDAAFSKMKNNRIFDLTAYFSNSKSKIYFDNNMLNIKSDHVPEKSIVSIEVAVPKLASSINQIVTFINDLLSIFDYDYCYVIELSGDYNFETERKIKKTIFGHKTSVEEVDRIWRYHSVGIKYGFVKNIYAHNFLNESQIGQDFIKRFIADQIGEFKRINKKVYLWSLSKKELLYVNDQVKGSKYLIANHGNMNSFLKTDDSKKFFNMMKLKH